MICYVEGCDEEVVAKIGLPSSGALWVCKRHFDEWGEREPPLDVAIIPVEAPLE